MTPAARMWSRFWTGFSSATIAFAPASNMPSLGTCGSLRSGIDKESIEPQPELSMHNPLLTAADSLVLPEAFIWHVFYSVANALCYCRHGTNKPHSGARELRWDRIIHGDLKQDNIVLAAPDENCHRLYPCLKLADFGEECRKPRQSTWLILFRPCVYLG